MSEQFVRASLRLWRWRHHRHHEKLHRALKAKDKREINRLGALIQRDHDRIDRRLRQLKQFEHHDLLWMPGAKRLDRSFGQWQTSCPPKGVLHTTEGSGLATTTLDANGSHPHFEVARDGTIVQYLPLGSAAKALRHVEATPTNGAHAYQIEVDGFAADPKWPRAQVRAMRKLMRFIEENGGVERAAHVSFTNPRRLSNEQWLRLAGWCGHVHVPQNDHTDPGKIDIEELLK